MSTIISTNTKDLDFLFRLALISTDLDKTWHVYSIEIVELIFPSYINWPSVDAKKAGLNSFKNQSLFGQNLAEIGFISYEKKDFNGFYKFRVKIPFRVTYNMALTALQ